MSCRDETIYQERILIQNSTNKDLSVILFPKQEYMDGDMYKFSSFGAGSRPKYFDISHQSEEEIYITDNLKHSPNELASQVFDSIYVIVNEQNGANILFTHDTVINYDQNLFYPDSQWSYSLSKFDLPTNFSSTKVISHDYSFIISQND